MRKEKWKAGRVLLQIGMTAALALGTFFIQTPQTVYAVDNSALYGSLGDIQDVNAGQSVTGAMANVTNQTVSQGTQPASGLTPVVQAAATANPLLPSERTVEVYLSERYNEEYKLYEFGFNNKYFFYSNVGNGAITSDAIKIEIPGNIAYSLEKDGRVVQYTQNTNITAVGSYVMTLTVNEVNGMETTHYVSYYRFRIMEPVEQVQLLPDETGEEDGNTSEANTEDILAEIEALEDLTPEEREALQAAILSGDYTGEELFNADGSVNDAAMSLLVTASLNAQIGTTEDIYHTDGVLDSTGMESVYDYTTGYYQHTLISGQVFYSDIQNGGITRQPVTIRTADKLDFTVYKDGVLYENNSTVFDEIGSYMLIPVADDVLYLSSYETEKPVFSFRIIDKVMNDLSVYHAPVGFRIDAVYMYVNGEARTSESSLIMNDTTVLLREDGEYRFRISSNAATMEVYYKLDRVHPRFTVQVEKNHAVIYYDSSDVARSIVYRGDKQYATETTILYEINETGEYRYFAQDAAGNVTGRAFKVRFGFNTGSFVTIFIIIAAIVGLFLYIKYINKNTKVR
ncbi:MAG: hypothetical protein K6G43_06655 [Lachnospiraceae bacterium]|nr:hypothetical protein [Lachnospiraceae bacterium]